MKWFKTFEDFQKLQNVIENKIDTKIDSKLDINNEISDSDINENEVIYINDWEKY